MKIIGELPWRSRSPERHVFSKAEAEAEAEVKAEVKAKVKSEVKAGVDAKANDHCCELRIPLHGESSER